MSTPLPPQVPQPQQPFHQPVLCPTSGIPATRRRRPAWSAAALMTVALLGILGGPSTAAAQQRGDFEIGGGPGVLDLDDKLGGDTGLALDARVGYFLTNRFQLEVQHTTASSVLDGSFRATTL
ncbi:MAG: hypothetical protein AAFY88_23015, partial [Acidobacteriota bacterium]